MSEKLNGVFRSGIIGSIMRNKELEAKKDHTSKLPVQLCYLFLSIPMYIFIFGWLMIPYAIFMCIVLTVGLFLACRCAPEIDVSFMRKQNAVKIIVMLILAMVWVYLAGIGKFAYQNYDHMWRNAILEKLVEEPWPVIINDTKGFFQNPVAMIYYFALWLPAALFGKIFGLEAAHVFLYFWCCIGVMLTFVLLTSLRKKMSLWMIIAFIFFSGLDQVGNFMLNNTADHIWFTTNHLEHWISGFQLSSNSTQLFWVYNQAIPAWLITLLLMVQKDNRSLVFIYSFSLLFCTLPAIGMIPIAACVGIHRIVKTYNKQLKISENIKSILREALTIQNVITGVLIAIISYLFLKANATGNMGFHFIDMKNMLMNYLFCVLIEFLVYYIAMYKLRKKEPLYWVSLATLLIVPMIYVGTSVDFVMRASIPALIVAFVLIFKTIGESFKSSNKVCAYALTGLLALGGITAYHEIMRTVCTTINHSYDETVALEADKIDLIEEDHRNNFFGEFQDSIFFKYLAPKK